MATVEGLRRSQKKREEAWKRNPLLKLNLGDLVREMNVLSYEDTNVLKSKKEVPEENMQNYKKYQSLIKEINRREKGYNSYKSPPRF